MATDGRYFEGQSDGTPFRARRARSSESPLVILLHGLGGDERAIWVFEHAFPEDWGLVAPRGYCEAPHGGFGWAEGTAYRDAGGWESSARRLVNSAGRWAEAAGVGPDRVLWLGFSQGAAAAFAAVASGLATLGVISLAGFVPDGVSPRVEGVPVFWAHGRLDRDVPIERARADVQRLRRLGANVEFCAADVDHRVGAPCLTALQRWIQTTSRSWDQGASALS